MTSNEFTQALEGMDPTELALGAGMFGIIATLILVGRILWFFVAAIGYYKMFQKAGYAGWKAFIPYYNDYIRYKFAWNTKLFWVFLVCAALIYFLPGSDYLLTGLLTLACAILSLVLVIKLDIRIAKSFGKTKGWGVLLFFFPFIVSFILGFGKAEYIGNTTIKAAETVDAVAVEAAEETVAE